MAATTSPLHHYAAEAALLRTALKDATLNDAVRATLRDRLTHVEATTATLRIAQLTVEERQLRAELPDPSFSAAQQETNRERLSDVVEALIDLGV